MTDFFGNIIIRSLPLQQPFASLMRYGKIETRTWDTTVRGKVLLYSTKNGLADEEIIEQYADEKLLWSIQDTLRFDNTVFLHGFALVIADLVDVRLMTPKDEEKCFIKYRPNTYCHIYENRILLNPFQYKAPAGTRKWATVKEESFLAELRRQGVNC